MLADAGHSLGAALSLLFAAELHSRHSELARRVAGIYAYATPRVGDAAFAKAFTDAFCNPRRYVKLYPVLFADAVSPLTSWHDLNRSIDKLRIRVRPLGLDVLHIDVEEW